MGLNALSGIGGFQTLVTLRGRPYLASHLSLNALSGIGGFQTNEFVEWVEERLGLNALSGIGGFQTIIPLDGEPIWASRLNALSGIGGFQTTVRGGR